MNKNNTLSLIQTFRGLAAILVLIHHGVKIGRDYLGYEYMNNIFSAGWIGVDFFFVLSGFIIYYIHSKDFGLRSKLKPFYAKRATRVYPIYWVITLSLLVMFFAVPDWGVGYERDWDVILKSFLLIPQSHDPILNVGWTLVHEMFFYLVFGILIFFRSKISKVLISIWVIGILLNSFSIISFNNLYFNFIFSNYNIEFLLGCVVGYLVLSKKIQGNLLLLTLGTTGFIGGWYLHLEEILERYQTPAMLVFGISFALVVLAAANIDLKNKPRIPYIFMLIGNASYSIYLTHFYLFIFLFKVTSRFENINPLNDFFTVTLSLTIVLICGIVFYIFIENPLIIFFNKRFINQNRKNKPYLKEAV